ncbi:unnamed protein product, partial [Tilletia laevis]
FTGTAHYMQ